LYEYDDPRYLNTKITQTIGLVQKDVKFAYHPTTGLNTTIERYVDGLLKVKTTNAYDTHGRLTGIEHKNSSNAVIATDSYVLDDLDRVKTQTLNGAPSTIEYDKTDQVTTVTGSNTEGYAYDLNGNRINTGYLTVSGNRLMSDGVYAYDYDPEGNRKSRTKIADSTVDLYTWDYRNRLKSIVSKTSMTGTVTRTVGYEYDVDDQRVRKTVTSATPSAGDGVENYYLDGNQIAFVTDGGGNKTFHYLYGLNVDAVMAADSPAGMVWALADRLGSIDTLTDKDGNVVDKRTFDSFGRVLSQMNPSVQFRYGYTGRELDLESGLDYYRARYYDPQVGRFISVDPMGFGAGDTNLYRYVGNNSTNAIDPSGLSWELPASWNDNLYAVDKYIAGVADLASFGATTSIRNSLYGDKVAGQHEGDLFTAGQWTGVALMTAVGLGSLRGAGFANSVLGNAAKVGLNGAKFGAGAGAGMSLLEDLDHGGLNGDSFGKALSKGTQGAIGGFKFGSQFGAAGNFGLLGQSYQLKMLVEGAAGSTMNAIDHFQNGEYWSGSAELINAFLGAKDAGKQAGNLAAGYQKAFQPSQCFVAGTEIQTLDGTKNIEDIHVGDWVLSDDPNTVGDIEYKQVLDTFVKQATNLVDIYIDGEKITTTEEHPFWVPDVGWVAAKDLHAGTLLQTKYESWLDVDRVVKHSDTATVYNFEVEGFHTYFVSDLGLLVHNTCQIGDPWSSFLDPARLNHSNLGEFTSTNRLWKGGHGQDNIIKLQNLGEQYNIVYEFSNGVRTGNVPNHKQKTKKTGVGQSWFPERWADSDIRAAGEFVVNVHDMTKVSDGQPIFAIYKGVRTGVFVNKSMSGEIGTIFPDNYQQPSIKDLNISEINPHF
jgi:RHS repeat-associated protein